MKPQHNFFLLSILCLFFQSLPAQVAIQFDKSYYSTGELIWYKVFLPSILKEKKIIIKGIFSDQEGKVKQTFFHKTEGNIALDGYLKIPIAYESGIYQLQFNGIQADSKEEIVLVQSEISIYNDLQIAKLEKFEPGKDMMEPQNSMNNDLIVDIKLNQESYPVRSAIQLGVDVKDKAGQPVKANLSIVSGFSDNSINQLPFFMGKKLDQTQLSKLGDMIYVKGQIMDSVGVPFKANVLGAYASLQNKIHYTKSDDQGYFTLEIPEFYEEQTLQFLPFSKEKSDISIRLKSDDLPPLKTKKLVVTNDILNYLEKSLQRKKMEQYYAEAKQEFEMEKFINEIQTLEPDYSYDTKKYIKFETVADFFTELLTPLKFKKTEGIYTASMQNPTAKITVLVKLKGDPMFIIDGKVTRDANFIANLSLSSIEKIDLFYIPDNIRKQFNVLGSSGVVRLTTVTPQFELPQKDKEDVFVISGLKPKIQVKPFVPESGDVHIPHFHTPVLWIPHLYTENNGNAKLEFFHSDETGGFEVIIVAQDEAGRMGFGKVKYGIR